MSQSPALAHTTNRQPKENGLALLAERLSSPALTLVAPGPNERQYTDLLTLAVRVPDHGRLQPWRFIILEGEAKASFADRLEARAALRADATRAKASIMKMRVPPLCIAIVSHVKDGKIPEWEQSLSAGAVCMSLLLAAVGHGFGANWITGWYAYDEDCKALLGLGASERIAGFVMIGTKSAEPAERVRPDITALTLKWTLPG